MQIPISTAVDLVNAAVCAYLAIRLGRAMHQDPSSRMLRYFFYSYCALTTAYSLLTIPRIFASQETTFLGIAFSLGMLCFLLGNAFFSKVVLAYTLPQWARPLFPIYLALSFVAFGWLFVARATPVVDTTTGITSWNADTAAGIFTAILFLIVLLPGAMLFIRQALVAKENHVVRVRSYTIGLGAAFLGTSAALVFLGTTEIHAVVSDFFSIAALLIIFLGVAYHRPKQLPLLTKQPPTNTPSLHAE